MRQQRTKDHTVGSQQESTVESIPAYDGGITSHQYQKEQATVQNQDLQDFIIFRN